MTREEALRRLEAAGLNVRRWHDDDSVIIYLTHSNASGIDVFHDGSFFRFEEEDVWHLTLPSQGMCLRDIVGKPDELLALVLEVYAVYRAGRNLGDAVHDCLVARAGEARRRRDGPDMTVEEARRLLEANYLAATVHGDGITVSFGARRIRGEPAVSPTVCTLEPVDVGWRLLVPVNDSTAWRAAGTLEEMVFLAVEVFTAYRMCGSRAAREDMVAAAADFLANRAVLVGC